MRKMNEVHDGVTCAVAATSDLIGSKWTALIVHDLSEGPRRFTELEHACPGISPRTLSERLHMLERQGIVERHSYPESPPRVEYELTDKGVAAAADHRGDAQLRPRLADRRARPRARRRASGPLASPETALHAAVCLTAQSRLGRLVAVMVGRRATELSRPRFPGMFVVTILMLPR